MSARRRAAPVLSESKMHACRRGDEHVTSGTVRAVEALHGMMGVDLKAFTIASEIGSDVSAFASAQHFNSWQGFASGTRVSVGESPPGAPSMRSTR